MNSHKGYYSLIQFCPDPSRLEGVNIGVVLFNAATGRLSYELTSNNGRIRKFFGTQDWDFIDRVKQSIENRLASASFETIEQFQTFVSSRANVIQLSEPRPLQITDNRTDTLALFRRLVDGGKRATRHRIATLLEGRLFEAGVANLVEKSVTVELPDLRIKVPFGYQNGRFNLISPVKFSRETEDTLEKAGRRAIEGQLLYDRQDPQRGPLQLVVVAQFEEGLQAHRHLVQQVFESHNVRLHMFDDIEPLVDDIRKSALMHSN